MAVTALVALLAGPAPAQQRQRVEVTVSFVTRDTAFLDKGKAAGLSVGDTVTLQPPGEPTIDAKVIALTTSSARIQLPPGRQLRESGIPGYVLIAADRLPASEAGPDRTPPPPEHAPWTRPLAPQEDGAPLLAPYGGPASRPMRIEGRTYAQLLHTWDQGEGRDNRFLLGRLGTELRAWNPLGLGGELHFDGEIAERAVSLGDGPDSRDTRGRLDRMSYAWGEDREHPVRIEVGRFLQREVPEFGVIDGAEVMLPFRNGGRLGLSLGGLTEPFPAMSTNDFAAVVSYHHAFDADAALQAGIAYEKTWHKGDADRDLFLATLDWAPARSVFLHGATWIDLYDSKDRIKDSGLQLTEAQLQTSWTWDPGHGVALTFLHMRWPEMLRNEFASLPPDLIRNNKVTRFDLSTWQRIDERFRLNARANWWKDQDTDGLGGELGASAWEWLWERGELALTGFWTDGAYLSGPGLRLSATRWFDSVFVRVGYRVADYELARFGGGTESILQQSLDASADFDVGEQTNVSVSLDWGFGEGQDYVTLGLFLQTRF